MNLGAIARRSTPTVEGAQSLNAVLLGALVGAGALAAAMGSYGPFGVRIADPLDGVAAGADVRGRLVAGALVAIVVAVGVGFVARRLSHRLGLVAQPRLWQAEPKPTALLGGPAIVLGLFAGVTVGGGGAIGSVKFGVATIGVLTLSAVGFVDDLKTLTPRTRLLLTAAAAELAWLAGLRAQVFPESSVGTIGNALVTMLWFVVVTHAFNIFDNLDGAAAGVGAASAFTLAILAIASGQHLVAPFAIAVGGACIGYLIHNFHRARLYMGDAGALAIGFSLAATGLMLRPGPARPLGFALPALAVLVPVFDAALVTIARVRSGRPIAVGDGTDHLSYRLLGRGMPVRDVVLNLWGAQIALGGVAIGISVLPRGLAWGVAAVVGLLGLAALWFILRLPEWRPSAETSGPKADNGSITRTSLEIEAR